MSLCLQKCHVGKGDITALAGTIWRTPTAYEPFYRANQVLAPNLALNLPDLPVPHVHRHSFFLLGGALTQSASVDMSIPPPTASEARSR